MSAGDDAELESGPINGRFDGQQVDRHDGQRAVGRGIGGGWAGGFGGSGVFGGSGALMGGWSAGGDDLEVTGERAMVMWRGSKAVR